MQSLPPPSSQLLDALVRSTASSGDARALRFTLGLLASFEDPRARFAHALLELSLARKGEDEAKGNLARIADELLLSWRDGNGAEFARLAPVLEELWTDAATLMVSFEVHRFAQALELCANSRGDAERLSSAIEKLLPEGNRAVELARCLYHLELARLGIDSSRVEFARRAGLLAEAYQSPEAAKQLIGTDDGLAQLWAEVLPYLDEFFEMMEEEAARRQPRPSAAITAPARASSPDSPPQPSPGAPPTAPMLSPPVLVPVTNEMPQPRPQLFPEIPEPAETAPEPAPLAVALVNATEEQPMHSLPPMAPRFAARPSLPPMMAPPVLAPMALGDTAEVPSFRTLLKKAAEKEAQERELDSAVPPLAPPPEIAEPIIEENLVEAIEDSGPPELALDDADLIEVPPGMPPPPPMSTGQHPIMRPPTPPPRPPAAPGPVLSSALDAVIEEDYTADEATLEFWRHTFTELELVPAENQPRSAERKLSADSRADRKRLTTYLDSLGPFIGVPEARSFSVLVRLLAAGQLKEKTLFGGVNARRAEAFAEAFSFLSKNPMSAAHAAEFFVLDGLDTEVALRRGLAVLTEYVFWCGAEGKDPLNFDAQAEFADRAPKK